MFGENSRDVLTLLFQRDVMFSDIAVDGELLGRLVIIGRGR